LLGVYELPGKHQDNLPGVYKKYGERVLVHHEPEKELPGINKIWQLLCLPLV
jgi:hypothetical protein